MQKIVRLFLFVSTLFFPFTVLADIGEGCPAGTQLTYGAVQPTAGSNGGCYFYCKDDRGDSAKNIYTDIPDYVRSDLASREAYCRELLDGLSAASDSLSFSEEIELFIDFTID